MHDTENKKGIAPLKAYDSSSTTAHVCSEDRKKSVTHRIEFSTTLPFSIPSTPERIPNTARFRGIRFQRNAIRQQLPYKEADYGVNYGQQ
jgi:hypothetical protein